MKKLAVLLLVGLAVVMAGCVQFGPETGPHANATHAQKVTANQTVNKVTNTTNTTQTVKTAKLVWEAVKGLESKIEPAVSYLQMTNSFTQKGKILNVSKEKNSGVYKVTVQYGNNTLTFYLTPDFKYMWTNDDMRQLTEGSTLAQKMNNFVKTLFKQGVSYNLVGTKKYDGLDEYDYAVTWQGRNYHIPVYRFGNYALIPNALKHIFAPTKTAKPKVDLYIMAFCPFGRQAAAAMAPVEKMLGKYANFTVHYVIYPSSSYGSQASRFCVDKYCSMHGVNETREDIRQLCIEKYYPNKFWSYLEEIAGNQSYSPSNIQQLWKGVAEKLGINTTKIEQCAKNEGVNLLKQQYELDQKYGVSGSPTLFINGAPWNWPRTPAVYKWAVCQAFTNPPSACNQAINATVNTTPAGNCG